MPSSSVGPIFSNIGPPCVLGLLGSRRRITIVCIARSTSDAHDSRGLELLPERRPRGRRRRDVRLLRLGHAFPVEARAACGRRTTAAALGGSAPALRGRVLPPQPARERASGRLAVDRAAPVRRHRPAGADRGAQREHGAARVRALPRARRRLRGHHLREAARLRARRPRACAATSRPQARAQQDGTNGALVFAEPDGDARTRIVLSRPGQLVDGRRRLSARARAARELGASARRPALARRRRTSRPCRRSIGSTRRSRPSATSSRLGRCGCRSYAAAGRRCAARSTSPWPTSRRSESAAARSVGRCSRPGCRGS